MVMGHGKRGGVGWEKPALLIETSRLRHSACDDRPFVMYDDLSHDALTSVVVRVPGMLTTSSVPAIIMLK